MFRVGITGGMGSGKSTVAAVFEILGVPVYYADAAAKSMMNEDPELREAIVTHFGEAAYADGRLNREYIASRVFSNAEQLELLNSLVHPATIRHAEAWMQKQNAPYAIKEAALIFESGSQAHLDFVIGVFAPKPIRLQRAMKRDGATRDEVLARMKKQIDESVKMRLCDTVIYNDEQHMIIPQVLALHDELLRRARLEKESAAPGQ